MKNKKTSFVLNITITGNTASLFLKGDTGKVVAELKWKDRKNLSEKLLVKIDLLLKKEKLSLDDISKVDFFCDSPYLKNKRKNTAVNSKNKKSKEKCGFTAWQVGEITAKTLNFYCGNLLISLNYETILSPFNKGRPREICFSSL